MHNEEMNAKSPSKAGLLQTLGLALFLTAPGAALADNECEPAGVDPSLNLGAADTFTCDPRDNFPNGITYTSDGDLTVQTIDLDSFRGPTFDVGTDGINVTAGNAADNLFWDSSGFISSRDETGAIEGTAGAVMDYRSIDGDIDILIGDQIAATRNATHAIRAEAAGSGNINITVGDDINNRRRLSGVGIEALTVGGDITIDADLITPARGEFSIIARSSAGGDILIDAESVNGEDEDGEGFLTETAGSTTIDMTGMSTSGFNTGFNAATTLVRTLGGGDVTFSISADGEPDEFRVSQYAEIQGAMDFSGAGSVQFNLGDWSAWQLGGFANSFSPGDDRLDIAPSAFIFAASNVNFTVNPVSALPFGAGQDTLNNEGTIIVRFSQEGQADTSEGSFLIEGLERFDNAGAILLGVAGNISGTTFDPTTTEGGTDDLLSIEGATYNGLSGSRIFMDVNYNAGGGQAGCDDSLRGADEDLPGADCVNIKNGATEGQTSLVLADRLPGDRGAYIPDGIVLIDVSGSDDPSVSGDDHFIIDPASDNYSSDFGGVIDKGLFVYTLGYDKTAQQHKLFGAPGTVALQLPLLAHAAQDLWRRSTTTWFERQLDVRDTLREDGDPTGDAWVRLTRDSAERDVIQDATEDGSIFYDNSYEQDNTAFNAGLDFFAGRSGDRTWLAGGMIGYVRADVEFDNSENEALLEGGGVGVYGSYIDGGFFVDAQLVGNWLSTVEYDAPALDLFPESAVLNTDVRTYGAEIETGWRWRAGWLSVEPLAGLSYARTSFDDVNIPSDDPARFGGNAIYDDPESFRGSLGARVVAEGVVSGGGAALPFVDLSLTARVVEEFEGESAIVLENVGPDAPIENTFDGTYAEVTGGVTVRNASGSVAGYLNVDGVFESDYESVGLTAGFRYRW